MGANAQTTVQKFLSGAVLTAEQQNTSAATGVPVFATTVTRDAAFGGANKVLAEGQTCYLESTNVVQYYDGAAWATVGPTAASGLVFVTGTPFTAVTSFSLPASTFTSTYTNYRILLNISGVSSKYTFRYRSGGVDNSNADYFWNIFAGTSYGGSSDTLATLMYAWDTATIQYGISLDIFSPQATAVTATNWQGFTNRATYDFNSAQTSHCMFRATTSFDSMTFISSTASQLTGSYKVYGYSNS